jgi:hypothetical protein
MLHRSYTHLGLATLYEPATLRCFSRVLYPIGSGSEEYNRTLFYGLDKPVVLPTMAWSLDDDSHQFRVRYEHFRWSISRSV